MKDNQIAYESGNLPAKHLKQRFVLSCSEATIWKFLDVLSKRMTSIEKTTESQNLGNTCKQGDMLCLFLRHSTNYFWRFLLHEGKVNIVTISTEYTYSFPKEQIMSRI